ncbi:hypothetical protein [Bacillus niameyensis]|nr:hypothetical protein [Bacillus niameyensis]
MQQIAPLSSQQFKQLLEDVYQLVEGSNFISAEDTIKLIQLKWLAFQIEK